jgi:Ni,Fe-hydrogenase I small subunit
VFNALSPNIKSLLIDEILPGKRIDLLFHATIMAASGESAIEVLRGSAQVEESYILVVEGAS